MTKTEKKWQAVALKNGIPRRLYAQRIHESIPPETAATMEKQAKRKNMSQKTKEKIVSFMVAGGTTVDAALKFDVHKATASRLFKLYKQNPLVSGGKRSLKHWGYCEACRAPL